MTTFAIDSCNHLAWRFSSIKMKSNSRKQETVNVEFSFKKINLLINNLTFFKLFCAGFLSLESGSRFFSELKSFIVQ